MCITVGQSLCASMSDTLPPPPNPPRLPRNIPSGILSTEDVRPYCNLCPDWSVCSAGKGSDMPGFHQVSPILCPRPVGGVPRVRALTAKLDARIGSSLGLFRIRFTYVIDPSRYWFYKKLPHPPFTAAPLTLLLPPRYCNASAIFPARRRALRRHRAGRNRLWQERRPLAPPGMSISPS